MKAGKSVTEGTRIGNLRKNVSEITPPPISSSGQRIEHFPTYYYQEIRSISFELRMRINKKEVASISLYASPNYCHLPTTNLYAITS